jgi:hypothetical protein
MALNKILLSPLKKLIDQLYNSRPVYQTFTYYIPAPPPRKTSYREKKLDSYCYKFLNLGFEIVSVKTAPHQSPTQNGFWLIFVLRALTEEAKKLELNFGESENLAEETELEIEYD